MGNITERYSGAEVYIFIEMTSTYKNTFVKERKKEGRKTFLPQGGSMVYIQKKDFK